MIGKPFDVRAEVYVESPHCLHDAGMQLAPSRSEDAVVDDFVRESMLKGVFELRKAFRLLEDLAGLQVRQAQFQSLLRQLGDLTEDREGHLVTYDRGRLEQLLVLCRQSINP